ncbi:MAG: RNHCP domain-containing protein [Oscillospiraceae bacterium]|nr:RNHCP domain-containing protein [Oscillospiraceae bacterium]
MKKKIIYKNTNESDGFTCKFCGWAVSPEGGGTHHRNHCPNCLSSLHLDNEPGDRAADCGGIMEAVGVWVRSGGEWAVIHRCKRCGEIHSNRVAADDSPVKLMAIALRPLANPPFPPERIEEISKALDNVK